MKSRPGVHLQSHWKIQEHMARDKQQQHAMPMQIDAARPRHGFAAQFQVLHNKIRIARLELIFDDLPQYLLTSPENQHLIWNEACAAVVKYTVTCRSEATCNDRIWHQRLQ